MMWAKLVEASCWTEESWPPSRMLGIRIIAGQSYCERVHGTVLY
jgi:hypothetical protein